MWSVHIQADRKKMGSGLIYPALTAQRDTVCPLTQADREKMASGLIYPALTAQLLQHSSYSTALTAQRDTVRLSSPRGRSMVYLSETLHFSLPKECVFDILRTCFFDCLFV